MNQKLKNYLKFGNLLFGTLFVLISCQSENIENIGNEPFQEKRIKTITLKDLNTKIKQNKKFIDLSLYFDINRENKKTQSQQKLDSSSEAFILTDEIIMIERENTTFYTFKIHTQADGYEFYNLIATVDDSGEISNLHILEYLPSNNWLQDMEQPFVGEVKLIENNLFTVNDITNFSAKTEISDCITGLTYEWLCNEGNNHYPGHPNCTDATSWEIIVTPQYGPCPDEIDAGDSSTGGGFPIDSSPPSGGGGTPTDTPYDGDFDTSPTYNKQEIKRKEKLLEMVKNPVIKSKIEELVPKIYSDTLTGENMKEDGARFKLIGENEYIPRDPNERFNYSVNYTPDYLQGEIVSVHIHQQKLYEASINLNSFDNSPVYSNTDITEFFENVNFIENTNPELTNDVTSFLISEQNEATDTENATVGMLALVVENKQLSQDAFNALQDPVIKDKFEQDFKEDVLKNSCNNVCMRKRIAKFINKYKINGQKLGIAIYQANILGNQITSWNKL